MTQAQIYSAKSAPRNNLPRCVVRHGRELALSTLALVLVVVVVVLEAMINAGERMMPSPRFVVARGASHPSLILPWVFRFKIFTSG